MRPDLSIGVVDPLIVVVAVGAAVAVLAFAAARATNAKAKGPFPGGLIPSKRGESQEEGPSKPAAASERARLRRVWISASVVVGVILVPTVVLTLASPSSSGSGSGGPGSVLLEGLLMGAGVVAYIMFRTRQLQGGGARDRGLFQSQPDVRKLRASLRQQTSA